MAMSATGKSPLLSFNSRALRECFLKLKREHGLTPQDIEALIDQWVLDVRSGKIELANGTAAWKIFLALLDRLEGELDEVRRRDAITYAPVGSLDDPRWEELLRE